MKAFWLTFTDGSQACCEGQSEFDAKRINPDVIYASTCLMGQTGPAAPLAGAPEERRLPCA